MNACIQLIMFSTRRSETTPLSVLQEVTHGVSGMELNPAKSAKA